MKANMAAAMPANPKGRYTLGDKLQQLVAATRCSDKSLRVYWRIFVKIFVAATEFVAATIQSDLIFCDLLQRQNYVAETKIFTKILQYTRSDLSLRRVASPCSCN